MLEGLDPNSDYYVSIRSRPAIDDGFWSETACEEFNTPSTSMELTENCWEVGDNDIEK